MTPGEKLKIVFNWLISRGLAKSQEDIAVKMRLNKDYVSQVVIGIKPVSKRLVGTLVKKFPQINGSYILNDEDQPISFVDSQVILETKMISLQSMVIEKSETIELLQARIIELQDQLVKLK